MLCRTAFGGPDQSVVTAGDHADDHFRLRPERRRALGGVEHAEPATGPRPDVDQPSSRAKGGFDEFYRLRHFAAGTGHGRGNGGVFGTDEVYYAQW